MTDEQFEQLSKPELIALVKQLLARTAAFAVAHDWRIRGGLILRHIYFRGVDGFGLFVLVFVLLWRQVAQRLVNPLTIIGPSGIFMGIDSARRSENRWR